MVLSAETRNLPCAANHYLIKEPFSSAAGLQLNTPKVVGETFRFRCSGLLGLRRLKADFVWSILSTTGDPLKDLRNVRTFQRRIRDFGLEDRYCLMLSLPPSDKLPLLKADPDVTQFFGMTRQELEQRLAGPNTLLNLSWSIRDPLVERFERRIYCCLDRSEIYFWMSRLEMGQSFHHEFWTIGLALNEPNIRLKELAPQVVPWRTFYPLVDTEFLQPAPRPAKDIFTTVGQWYWDGYMDVEASIRIFPRKQPWRSSLRCQDGSPMLASSWRFGLTRTIVKLPHRAGGLATTAPRNHRAHTETLLQLHPSLAGRIYSRETRPIHAIGVAE